MINIYQLLKNLTGKEIKVCIIDSGIDKKLLAGETKNILTLKVQDGPKGLKILNCDEEPLKLHGTNIANIVRSYAPKCHITSIQIFHDKLSANLTHVIEALSYVFSEEFDIVNLSLVTHDKEDIEYLEYYCKQLFKKNNVLISAIPNKNSNMLSYPSSFHTVFAIGHKKGRDKFTFHYIGKNNVDFLMDGSNINIFAKEVNLKVGYTSYSAARMTGIVALIKEKFPHYGPQEIKDILIKYANGNNNKI